MTKKGMTRFLESLGLSSYENLRLSNIKTINLRSNGNQYLDDSDEITFDMTNELIKIKEYTKEIKDGVISYTAKSDNKYDIYLTFFSVVGFSL